MPDMYDFAAQLIRNNQQIANTPMGQNFLQALEQRDQAKLEQMGNNILNNQGIDMNTAQNDIRNNVKSIIPKFPFTIPF